MSAHTCHQLGVCADREPGCADCPYSGPLGTRRALANTGPVLGELAPGVLDGPYRRPSVAGAVTIRFKQGAAALSPLAAWLMGPHP